MPSAINGSVAKSIRCSASLYPFAATDHCLIYYLFGQRPSSRTCLRMIRYSRALCMCKVAISVQCTYFVEAPVLAAECNKHRRLLDNSKQKQCFSILLYVEDLSKWSSIQAVSGSNVATVILCLLHFSPLDFPLRMSSLFASAFIA